MVGGVLVCHGREGRREFMATGTAEWRGALHVTAKFSWPPQVLFFYSFAFLEMIDGWVGG